MMLSLTHLEFGILLADHVETAFALYDLAVLTALLDGCLYFHYRNFYLYLKDILPFVKS